MEKQGPPPPLPDIRVAYANGKQETLTRIGQLPLGIHLSNKNFLQEDEKASFAKTLLSKKRISTGLAERTASPSTTGWFRQHREDCGIWALVNGMNEAGIAFTPEVRAFLGDVAKSEEEGSGIEDSVITTLAARNTALKDSIVPENNLRALTIGLGGKAVTEVIRHNAHTIQADLEGGAILRVALRAKPYNQAGFQMGFFEEDYHAATIIDYAVNKEGYMNLLVVDPNFGRVWVSLEHISKALRAQKVIPKIFRKFDALRGWKNNSFSEESEFLEDFLGPGPTVPSYNIKIYNRVPTPEQQSNSNQAML